MNLLFVINLWNLANDVAWTHKKINRGIRPQSIKKQKQLYIIYSRLHIYKDA